MCVLHRFYMHMWRGPVRWAQSAAAKFLILHRFYIFFDFSGGGLPPSGGSSLPPSGLPWGIKGVLLLYLKTYTPRALFLRAGDLTRPRPQGPGEFTRSSHVKGEIASKFCYVRVASGPFLKLQSSLWTPFFVDRIAG